MSYNVVRNIVSYNYFITKTMNFLLMKVPNEEPIWSTLCGTFTKTRYTVSVT